MLLQVWFVIYITGTIPGAPTLPPTTPSTCGAGMMKCQTVNKCFSIQQQCDFIDDCGDYSDEQLCGRYPL